MIVTMRITTITVTFHNTKKKKKHFKKKFKNIFENNFYMVIKRGVNVKRNYILTVCNMTCLNLC